MRHPISWSRYWRSSFSASRLQRQNESPGRGYRAGQLAIRHRTRCRAAVREMGKGETPLAGALSDGRSTPPSSQRTPAAMPRSCWSSCIRTARNPGRQHGALAVGATRGTAPPVSSQRRGAHSRAKRHSNGRTSATGNTGHRPVGGRPSARASWRPRVVSVSAADERAAGRGGNAGLLRDPLLKYLPQKR